MPSHMRCAPKQVACCLSVVERGAQVVVDPSFVMLPPLPLACGLSFTILCPCPGLWAGAYPGRRPHVSERAFRCRVRHHRCEHRPHTFTSQAAVAAPLLKAPGRTSSRPVEAAAAWSKQPPGPSTAAWYKPPPVEAAAAQSKQQPGPSTAAWFNQPPGPSSAAWSKLSRPRSKQSRPRSKQPPGPSSRLVQAAAWSKHSRLVEAAARSKQPPGPSSRHHRFDAQMGPINEGRRETPLLPFPCRDY